MTSGSFYFYAGECFAGKTLSREEEIQRKSQLYLGIYNLDGWDIKSFAELSRCVTKAVKHYNNKRRHRHLNWQTPMQFERAVQNQQPGERIKMKLYKHLESCLQNKCE